MKARVQWLEGAAFVAESGSGHTVVMDGPPDHGGRNIGIRPMEMLLIGLGGCTAFDVVHILGKSRQAVTGCTVDVEADRAAEPPAVFTAIRLHYTVRGRDLSERIVARAVALSAEKYCSASLMLAKTAAISHTFEIDPAE